MSKTGEYYLDLIEKLRNEKLAKDIGLTYEELIETDFNFETIESKEGLVYEHTISFDESSPKKILNKIFKLHGGTNISLSPFYDYDDDFLLSKSEFDAIRSKKNYVSNFRSEVENLKELIKLKTPTKAIESILKRQVFIGTIGALETFLSEVFINLTNDNIVYFKNFIKHYPEFKKQKLSISEIYEYYDSLNKLAEKEMLEVIYHNLAKVKNMYTSTFQIEFPPIEELSKYVAIRHDLVHRNGKDKNGKIIILDDDLIQKLFSEITAFVEPIISRLNIIY